MSIRRFSLIGLAAFVVAAGGGCEKSGSEATGTAVETKSTPASTNQPASASSPISHIHWLGKKRLSAETNAAYFMSVWNMPETAKLEAMVLDKLALAFWYHPTNFPVGVTNYQALFPQYPFAPLLRPVFEDLVQEESYAEVVGGANQTGELALAIRLDEKRAGLWESNLASGITLLTGAKAIPAAAGARGWDIALSSATSPGAASTNPTPTPPSPPRHLRLSRAGDWTLLACSPGPSTLLADLQARIERNRLPFSPGQTNFWLEGNADLAGVSAALGLGWNLPAQFPQITATVIGDGTNVRSHAVFDFPKPLGLELDAWTIPTNLVHDPLIGFTAVRGIRSLLGAWKPWADLQLGTPPNQAYFWAQAGAPWLHFVALPSMDASNQVRKLGDVVINKGNQVMIDRGSKIGTFERSPGASRVVWHGIPLFSPTLDLVQASGTPFIFAGFFPNRLTNQPAPAPLLSQVYDTDKLVCYDWELTGLRLDGLTPNLQLLRRAFQLPRLPPETTIAWLRSVFPRLDNSATAIVQGGPARLVFTRKSTIGLTAAEIHLLVDWLESPAFPYGIHTFTAPLTAEEAPPNHP